MVLANDYRHPVVVAKEAATLDVLTGGRFELGIGAGWMTADYEAAGIPLDAAGRAHRPAGRGDPVLQGPAGPTSPFTFDGDALPGRRARRPPGPAARPADRRS